MIQSVPTPKLVIVSNETRKPLKKNRLQPKTQDPADFRWGLVEEFLRSRELQPNSKKAYTRNLRAFLDWTAKGLNEISARDIDRYKAHLKTLPSKRGVKAIAKLAGVPNAFTHRGRHTMATNLVLKGVDPMLARQITRHKSEKSFARYSKRALEVEAERQFYEAFGE